MDIYFGIASYKRADNQKTVAYLESLGVPRNNIILSVQTAADYDAYRAAGIEKRVGGLIFRPGGNASQNRNNILDNVPAGTKIVLLDDDIMSLCKLKGDALEAITTGEEFYKALETGYKLAAKYKTIGFGVYPVCNAFYMSNKHRDRYIAVGTLLGITNTSLRFDPQTDTKEDYQFCCEAIRKYGAFVRMDNYSCKAQHYTSGGCEEFWDDTAGIERTARRLAARYSDIIELNPKRKGEVRMKRGNK